MGGNNISVTDLSVYQSALTKIGQNLSASAANRNMQQVSGEQKIKFINAGAEANPCGNSRDKNRKESEDLCRNDCQFAADRYLEYGGNVSEITKFQTECNNTCSSMAIVNYPPCTPQESSVLRPTIIGCDIDVSQTMSQSISATQIASAQIDAEMTASVMNTFENEVEKIISQTNEDLNFMQSNSAHERTQVSQSVRNEISNAIDTISSNTNSSWAGGVQEVEFINAGYISCCGSTPCDPDKTDCSALKQMSNTLNDGEISEGTISGQPCGKISITQDMMQDLETNQKATSVIESVFNSSVVNDLYNKYKYDLAQKNLGIDPWGFMYALAIIIGLLILGTFIVGRQVMGTIGEIFSTPWPWIFLVVVIAIAIGVPSLTAGLGGGANTQTGGGTVQGESGAVSSVSWTGGDDIGQSGRTYNTSGGSGSGLTVAYGSTVSTPSGTWYKENSGSGYQNGEEVTVDETNVVLKLTV